MVDSLRECVASQVVAVRVAGAGLLDVTASYPAHQDLLSRYIQAVESLSRAAFLAKKLRCPYKLKLLDTCF